MASSPLSLSAPSSHSTTPAQSPRQQHLTPSPQPFSHRGPSRQGQAASTRNFNQSSAGGASRGASGSPSAGSSPGGRQGGRQQQLTEEQNAKRSAWGESYVVGEETIRNDYSTHYVNTGERPQNNIRASEVESRFSEYPKLSNLLTLKHKQLASPSHSIPPTYLQTTAPMGSLLNSLAPSRFDAILISPPPSVTFEDLQALDLGKIAGTPGFLWLWVGSGQRGDGIGLERGRELIAGWGYRRCEDIVWLKTNKANPAADLVAEGNGGNMEEKEVFTPTLEHCLMAIRGTVRRSNDSWFAHCNVDTDVIVWEGDEQDPALKPPELQTLVENFCQGTRRLHLWGSRHSLRRGWLTIGEDFSPIDQVTDKSDQTADGVALVDKAVQVGGEVKPTVRKVERETNEWEPVAFDAQTYAGWFSEIKRNGAPINEALLDADETFSAQLPVSASAPVPVVVEPKILVDKLLPFVDELDALRPKSPPPRNGQLSSGGLGRGRGAGLGVTRSGPALSASPSPQGFYGQPSPRGRGRGMSPHSSPSHSGYSTPNYASYGQSFGQPGQMNGGGGGGYGIMGGLRNGQMANTLAQQQQQQMLFLQQQQWQQQQAQQQAQQQWQFEQQQQLQQQQLILQQQQQAMYNQWLAMGGAAGPGGRAVGLGVGAAGGVSGAGSNAWQAQQGGGGFAQQGYGGAYGGSGGGENGRYGQQQQQGYGGGGGGGGYIGSQHYHGQ